MFFKSEELVNAFVNNVATFSINGSLGAGTLGREGEAMITTATMKQGILIFCQTKGLYGGVSLEFSGVLPDRIVNSAFYGEAVSSDDILNVIPTPKNDILDKMYESLNSILE